MTFFNHKKHKSGFTIVELVIVIAVIALLTTILVPTFSYVIRKAKTSRDIHSVTNINKIISIEYTVNDKKDVEYSEIKDLLNDNNIKVPFSPESSDSKVYWVPDINKAVLYTVEKNKVLFPEDYKDLEKQGTWVDMSVGDAAPHVEDEETHKEPEETEEHTEEHTEDPPTEPTEEIEEEVPEDDSEESYNKYKEKHKNKFADYFEWLWHFFGIK